MERTERGTRRRRQVAAEGINKDRSVQNHELFRHLFKMQKALFGSRCITRLIEEVQTTASAPLSGLKVITLPELILGKRHHGRVLYGRLCVTPFKVSSVNSVLEDSAGRGVRVTIYNVLSSTASSTEIEARFPLGMKVLIKEPFFKVCADGKTAVRVDNPADILPYRRNQDIDDSSAADLSNESDNTEGLEEGLDTIRWEGNRLFGAQIRLEKVNAYGLELFEKLSEAFKASLEQTPQQQSILDDLKSSTTAYEQSRSGDFDCDVPSCDDVVGPVEIRRVHYGCGRRGLFATKRVEAGKVLLVSNALATTYLKSDSTQGSVNLQFKARGRYKEFDSSGSQQDLIAKLTNRAMASKRQIAQLYTLAVHGAEEMDIPSMELFRPGSEWVPPSANNLAVDIGLIREIARLNAVVTHAENVIQINCKNRLKDEDCAARDVYSGLWVLPSFLNHSCAPNCLNTSVGGVLFVRASREILKGEELTISYFEDLFENKETRQEKAKCWLFACKCERCLVEESLNSKAQLSKISKRIHLLAAEIKAFAISEEGPRRQATKQLAGLADNVEDVLHSQDIDLSSKQQGWIRAAFLQAYVSKYKLAIDEDDAQSRVAALVVIVVSMTSVSPRPVALRWAAVLLKEVERTFFKDSQAYQFTEKRVLGIYRIFFGKESKKILLELVRQHLVGAFTLVCCA